MATQYYEIYELFLAGIKDYVIDKLYIEDLQYNTSTAQTYMMPYLIKAIPKFGRCVKDLEDRDNSTMTFNITLDTDEVVILSDLMIIEWFKREINDIRQIKLRLTDDAFKSYAEANNLKAKVERMASMRETVDNDLLDYSHKHIDWTVDFG